MQKPHKKWVYLVSMAVILLVVTTTACAGKIAPEEAESTEAEIGAEADQEPAVMAAVEEVPVMYQEMQFPDSEFLFEVYGVGGPMFPCRFYLVNDVTTDQAAQYYLEKLPWFTVEQDEVLDGHRHFQIDNSSPVMNQLGVENPEDLVQVGSELDGRLVGVEVVHSNYTGGFSNLSFAIASGDPDKQIPPDATIIVLVYFSNPY